MKGGAGRKIFSIFDFSGGQVTRPPVKGIDKKYSVDCLNVYAEGITLTERSGYTVENPTALSGAGNGFVNWVKNVTDQSQVVYFGTTLSIRSVVSGAWGTFSTLSRDTAHGTAFTNGLMHFVTFNGTLIMTTEQRDKPQYIRVTDSSHFDLEFGGAGSAPFAKYPQVWKNHLWLLNIGGGSEMSDECSSITSWTDNDVNTGASTQTTFDSKDTFRFQAGTVALDVAQRTKTVTDISSNYSFEIKTYFDLLGTVASGDYAEINIHNGDISFEIRFSDDGLEVNDGSTWNEVGVDLVTEDGWIVWKFIVSSNSGTDAKVDIYKNGIPVGLQVDCSKVDTTLNGRVDIYSRAGGSVSRADWYIDYIYINKISAVTNYLQNNQFETWEPLNGSCATFSTASQSYLSVPDHASFNFADGAFTIELLVNRAAASTARIGLYTQSTDTANQIFFGILNNAVVFSCVTGGATVAYHSTASLTWNTAEWYALALSRNGSDLKILRGGQDLAVSATTALGAASLPDFSSTIYFGAWAGSANGLAGSLDEIRVSTSARYSAGYNISTANFSSDANTSILLHLDSAFTDSGPNAHTVTTASGVANTTTPLNALSWHASTSLTTAREGTAFHEGTYAIKLSGTGSYSQTLSMPSGIAGQSAYVAGWIKPPASGQYQFVITDGTNTYNSDVFVGASTAYEYRYHQFTTVSSATAVTVNLNVITSNTFYADSLALIPAGTVAFSSDYSDRIQRTAIGFYNDFTGTDSGTNDIITDGDVGLTGSAILNDRMFVFKRWSIHHAEYTGSVPLISIRQLKKTVGTTSPRSIKNIDIPEIGEALIFLGSDRRLYIFDRIIPFPISDEMTINNGISSVYFDNINTQALDKVWAVVHQDLNWYELFVPIGNSATPNYSIVYDYSLKSFWPMDNRNFLSGGVSDNAAGQRRVYAVASTSGVVALTNSSTSDGGSAINSYWTSTKIGVSQMLSRIDELEVETAAVTGCTPTFSWRCDWESSYVAKTMAANTNSHMFAPGRMDNLIQFKIANNTTTASFKLWTINMAERPLGIGK